MLKRLNEAPILLLAAITIINCNSSIHKKQIRGIYFTKKKQNGEEQVTIIDIQKSHWRIVEIYPDRILTFDTGHKWSFDGKELRLTSKTDSGNIHSSIEVISNTPSELIVLDDDKTTRVLKRHQGEYDLQLNLLD